MEDDASPAAIAPPPSRTSGGGAPSLSDIDILNLTTDNDTTAEADIIASSGDSAIGNTATADATSVTNTGDVDETAVDAYLGSSNRASTLEQVNEWAERNRRKREVVSPNSTSSNKGKVIIGVNDNGAGAPAALDDETRQITHGGGKTSDVNKSEKKINDTPDGKDRLAKASLMQLDVGDGFLKAIVRDSGGGERTVGTTRKSRTTRVVQQVKKKEGYLEHLVKKSGTVATLSPSDSMMKADEDIKDGGGDNDGEVNNNYNRSGEFSIPGAHAVRTHDTGAVVAKPVVDIVQETEVLRQKIQELEQKENSMVVASEVRNISQQEDSGVGSAIIGSDCDDEETGGNNNPHNKKLSTTINDDHGSERSNSLILCIVAMVVTILVIAVVVTALRSGKSDGRNDIDDVAMPPSPSVPEAAPTATPMGLLPPTLDIIHERGYIKCRGESFEVRQGFGFSVDMCSALAAAVLGNASAYQMPLIPFREQWASISNGTMDVSTTQTTANMQRDILEPLSKRGYTFSTPYYYSGVTFAATSQELIDCIDQGETLLGVCRELSVCVLEASIYTDVVQKLLGGSAIHLVAFSDDLFTSFASGICNVVTGSQLLIYEQRVRDAGYEGDYVFSPRIYDPEPFALTTRGSDSQFGDFANWLLRGLIVAESLNITSANYEEFPTTDLFGPAYSSMFQNAIQAVGNYGDMYGRYLQDRAPRRPGGINTPHLSPGDGGLIYANPFGDLSVDFEAYTDEDIPNLGPIPNGTLERVLERGNLRCGMLTIDEHYKSRTGLVFYNDTAQAFSGIDVDLCKGITGALFAGKLVEGVTYELVVYEDSDEAFEGLSTGEIDFLAGATYSIENDVRHPVTQHGYAFSDIYYYYQVIKVEIDEESGSPTPMYQVVDDDYDIKFDNGDVLVYPVAIATREDDTQFTDFVRSLVVSTIYAEANGIAQTSAVDMPIIELFGSRLQQSLREIILAVGNYGEIYERNMEQHIPRSKNRRNTLNTGGNPQLYSSWKF